MPRNTEELLKDVDEASKHILMAEEYYDYM